MFYTGIMMHQAYLLLINHQTCSMEQKNIIVEKSLQFSVEIVKFCELLDFKKKYVIAKQLLRSGTSIGANVFEAQHAESKADFIQR